MTVYRVAPLRVLCARCRQPAVFCCPGCGTATCQEHTDFVDLCQDCARALDAAEQRVGRVGACLLAVLGVLAGAWLGWPLVTVTGALFGGAGGVFAGASYRGLRQALVRRAYRKRSASFVLEGACLTITRGGAEEEDDWRSHRGAGYPNRTRGELPEVPFYQRTYTGI